MKTLEEQVQELTNRVETLESRLEVVKEVLRFKLQVPVELFCCQPQLLLKIVVMETEPQLRLPQVELDRIHSRGLVLLKLLLR